MSIEDARPPRTEAGILPYAQLSEAQKVACQRVLSLLRGLGASQSPRAGRPRENESLITLDVRRHNRVLLIDGSRGSGKTALLISLLDALQRDYQQTALGQIDPRPSDAWLATLRRHLAGMVVVPTALIDLTPLPFRANLLLHIVSCLERVVQELEALVSHRREPRAPLPPFHADSAKPLLSRSRWQGLAHAAMLGWDASEKQGAPDPESHARQLMAEERQRHLLTDCFAAFFEALVGDCQELLRDRLSGHKLLFLVAIDDADMIPSRIPALLDALRLFGHREIPMLFLLTGDSRLFLQALSAICLDDIAGRVRSLHLQRSDLSKYFRDSRRLAGQIYDKLIPPHQRCEIHQVPFFRRLDTQVLLPKAGPVSPGDSAATVQSQTLRELLKLQTADAASSLIDYFTWLPWLAEALPGHFRSLTNLGHMLYERQEVEKDRPDTAVVKLVADLWQMALEDGAQPAIGAVELRADSSSLHVVLKQEPERVGLHATDIQALPRKLSATDGLWVQVRHAGLALVDELPPSEATDRAAELSCLVLGGLLADDLWQKGCRVENRVPLGSRSGYEPLLAYSELAFSDARARSGEPRHQLTLGWPLPQGASLLDQARIGFRWLVRRGAAENSDERIALAFLQAICVLGHGRSSTLPSSASLAEVYQQIGADLASLAQRNASSSGPQEAALSEWARARAGLLAAPESGLSVEVANRLLHTLRKSLGSKSWPTLREQLKGARRQRMESALVAQPSRTATDGAYRAEGPGVAAEPLLSRLDAGFPAFNWQIEIEEGEDGALIRILRDLQLPLQVAADTRSLFAEISVDLLRRLMTWQPQRSAHRVAELLSFLWQQSTQRESYSRACSDEELQRAQSVAQAMAAPRAAGSYPHSVTLSRVTALRGTAIAPTGGLFACRLYALRPSRVQVQGPTPLPLQLGLLTLQWDEDQKLLSAPLAKPGATPEPEEITLWRGVEMQVPIPGAVTPLFWPAVYWRSVWVSGRITEQWNQMLQQVQAQKVSTSDGVFLESLAFFYVQLCFTAPFIDQPLPRLQLRDYSEQEWELLFQECEDRTRASGALLATPEREALLEFWHVLTLLLTPESGLPYATVSKMLSWFIPQEGKSSLPVEAVNRSRDRLRKQCAALGAPAWLAVDIVAEHMAQELAARTHDGLHPYLKHAQPDAGRLSR